MCRPGLLVFAFCTSLAAAAAQDSVRLATGQTIRGVLQQWDDRGVRIRLDNGKDLEYTPDAIAQVAAALVPEHQQADIALAAGKIPDAIAGYQAALTREQRPWAVGRIRLGLLRGLRQTGQILPAAELFLELAKQRPDIDLMAFAPLLWALDDPQAPALRATAREWIDNRRQDPLAALLACSWLLGTPDGEKVQPLLDNLRTYPDSRISWFARLQFQRYSKAPFDQDTLRALEQLLSEMPVAVRPGPQYALGLTYERANRPADAALAYLWVPFVYNTDPALARSALYRAAEACRTGKMADEASKLYRELIEKYPDSNEAKLAAQRLGS